MMHARLPAITPTSPDNLPAPSGAQTLGFEDMQALSEAVRLLERTSLTGRLSRIIGERAGGLGALIPAGGRKVVALAVDAALYAAMRTALRSLRGRRMRPAHFHKSIASLSGAAGGAFGFAALPVELPVSTVLMLRAIADTARAEGEDLDDPQTRMACMEVFALGGRTPDDDALDSAYFAMRAVLAQTVSAAAQYAAVQGAAKDTAPIIVKLISEIATRFGIAVSQKAAAQAVPVIGALAGPASIMPSCRISRDWRAGTSRCGGWNAPMAKSACGRNICG